VKSSAFRLAVAVEGTSELLTLEATCVLHGLFETKRYHCGCRTWRTNSIDSAEGVPRRVSIRRRCGILSYSMTLEHCN
jgi:hypothetical protein